MNFKKIINERKVTMIKKSQKFTKKKFLLLIICVAIISLSFTPLNAGKCEDAWIRCMKDWGFFDFFNPLGKINYCTRGYFFCIRFLEE